jgi:hypothetical protein
VRVPSRRSQRRAASDDGLASWGLRPRAVTHAGPREPHNGTIGASGAPSKPGGSNDECASTWTTQCPVSPDGGTLERAVASANHGATCGPDPRRRPGRTAERQFHFDPTQTSWCWRGQCSRLGTSKQMKSQPSTGNACGSRGRSALCAFRRSGRVHHSTTQSPPITAPHRAQRGNGFAGPAFCRTP